MIDHREWTPGNGRNNALRINGLGAPRAFFTPLLREIKAPNTSYGEDYALGLNISRRYRIGRIYDELYLCRRWEENSDASLDITKVNAHNLYKDRIRTWELQARKTEVAEPIIRGDHTGAGDDRLYPPLHIQVGRRAISAGQLFGYPEREEDPLQERVTIRSRLNRTDP